MGSHDRHHHHSSLGIIASLIASINFISPIVFCSLIHSTGPLFQDVRSMAANEFEEDLIEPGHPDSRPVDNLCLHHTCNHGRVSLVAGTTLLYMDSGYS